MSIVVVILIRTIYKIISSYAIQQLKTQKHYAEKSATLKHIFTRIYISFNGIGTVQQKAVRTLGHKHKANNYRPSKSLEVKVT